MFLQKWLLMFSNDLQKTALKVYMWYLIWRQYLITANFVNALATLFLSFCHYSSEGDSSMEKAEFYLKFAQETKLKLGNRALFVHKSFTSHKSAKNKDY